MFFALIIVSIAFISSIICAWMIVAYLEKESIIEKNTILKQVSWGAFIKYYQIKKEKNGSYGLVGIIYIVSISVLFIAGAVFLFRKFIEPF